MKNPIRLPLIAMLITFIIIILILSGIWLYIRNSENKKAERLYDVNITTPVQQDTNGR